MKSRQNPYLSKYEKYRKHMMFEKFKLWLLETKLKITPQYNNKIEDEYRMKGANMEVSRTRHLDNMKKRYKQLNILIPKDPKTYVKNIADQSEKRKLINTLRKVFPLRPTVLNFEYLKLKKQVNEMKKATSHTQTYSQFLKPLGLRRMR